MAAQFYHKIFVAIIAISSVLNAKAQSFSWAQGFFAIGSSNTYGIGINRATIDGAGNLYTVGFFSGITDFDPGPGVYNLTSVSHEDMFIMKENALGNLIWVKQVAGLSSGVYGCSGRSIDVDLNGNVIITGNFVDSFDFDPGPSVYKLNSFGSSHAFILKLDVAGNFMWVGDMGTQTPSVGIVITTAKQDKNGDLYLAGVVYGNGTTPIDVDPTSGVYNIIPSGNVSDFLLEKLDSNGHCIWAKLMTGTSGKFTSALDIDSASNVFIAGRFMGSCDFDPGPGVYTLTATPGSVSDYDIFVAKYDSAGNFVWAKRIGSTSDDEGYGAAVDPFGNVLVSGFFGGTVDFDPGSGVYNLTANSTKSVFVLKLHNNGNFTWANKTGGWAGIFNGSAIATDSLSNVYTTMQLSTSCDLDPGPAVYNVPAGCAVQKLDSSGNFVWGAGWQGDVPSWVGLDHANNVYTTGTFSGFNQDFDPGPGTYFLSGTTQGSGFILKLCQQPTATQLLASAKTVCTGDTVLLTANAPVGSTYKWYQNGNLLPGTGNTRKATTGGTYIVETNTGCPGYDSVVLTFNNKVFPKFLGHLLSTRGVANDTVQVGQNFALETPMITINDTSNSVKLSWYKNNILYAITIGHPGFSSYLIFIPKNTTGNDTFFVVVNKVNKIDTMCWVPDTSTSVIIYGVNGINDLHANNYHIKVYPNPTMSMISVESDRMMTRFVLYDLIGKQVFQTLVNNNRFNTQLPVANGVYFYEVEVNGSVVRGKLIVGR